MTLLERVHMPSFAGATEWLNSEPLGHAVLQGHVVLVNFWTLTCINWLRQEPYVRAWTQADGLVVIGVHTPEFSFEHDIDRVRRRPPGERSTIRSRSTTTTRSGTVSPTTPGRRCTSSTPTAGSATGTSAKDATRNRSASSRSCSASTASSSPSKASAWSGGRLGPPPHVVTRSLWGSETNRWPAPTEPQRSAFQAGHAGSIPVTRSTRFRVSGHWRPLFRSIGHELVRPDGSIQPGRGLVRPSPVTTTGHGVSLRPRRAAIRRAISSAGTANRPSPAVGDDGEERLQPRRDLPPVDVAEQMGMQSPAHAGGGVEGVLAAELDPAAGTSYRPGSCWRTVCGRNRRASRAKNEIAAAERQQVAR
jgi:hypothetical protein